MRALSRLPLVAVLSGLAGCAAGGGAAPASLEEALPAAIASVVQRSENPRIEAVYSDGVTILTLRNAAWGEDDRAPNVKFATDADVQNLAASWTRLHFFENATPAVTGTPRATLTLRIDDRQWVRARRTEDAAEFNLCLGAFQHVYNMTVSFRAVQNLNVDHFETEREHANRKQQEVLRRWGQK